MTICMMMICAVPILVMALGVVMMMMCAVPILTMRRPGLRLRAGLA
jgi:hypothetical protein